MRVKDKFCLVCILMLFSSVLVGQSVSYAIKADYGYGRIIPHSDRFLPEVTENSQFFNLSYIHQTKGKKTWPILFHFPELIFNLQYADYGDAELFGNSISWYTALAHKKPFGRVSGIWQYGFGMAYIDSPYHRINNSSNNVIGSEINLTMKLEAGILVPLSRNFDAQLMFQAMHHSNGRAEIPNLGINVLAVNLGLRYNFYTDSKDEQFPSYDTKEKRQELKRLPIDRKKEIRLGVNLGFARHELNAGVNGPKFPIYVFSLMAQRRNSQKSKWLLGAEYTYFDSTYRFIVNNDVFPDKHRLRSSRVSLYGGYEHIIGRVGIVGMLGYYLYKPFQTEAPISTKMGFKYYVFPTHERLSKEFFLSGYLKSHYAKAEYLEFGIGYAF